MKINPKLKNLTEEEREAWEEKMRYLEGDNTKTHALEKIKQGRGWIF